MTYLELALAIATSPGPMTPHVVTRWAGHDIVIVTPRRRGDLTFEAIRRGTFGGRGRSWNLQSGEPPRFAPC